MRSVLFALFCLFASRAEASCPLNCLNGTPENRCAFECVANMCVNQAPASQRVTCNGGCCVAPVPNSHAFCPLDAVCKWDCDSGYVKCANGSACLEIGQNQCCTADDCTNVPAHAHATCEAGSCGWACDSGYHACGSVCVSDFDPAYGCSTSACAPSACPAPKVGSGASSCSGHSCAITCSGPTPVLFSDGCYAADDPAGGCGSGSACTAPPHGTAICTSTSCDFTCNSGYHRCGSSCAADNDPATGCGGCTPCAAPSGPGHAICNGAACGLACNGGYKLCGTTCIPNASCCTNNDCAAGPACHKSQGTCGSPGASCVYAYDDGAPCDADGTKCTPNDTCKSGVCVADAAHQVTCTKKDCYSTPTCDPVTGNCVSTPLTGGTCGASGCFDKTATCAGGVCTGAQPKDCSASLPECKVGVCDSVTGKCGSENAVNGIQCVASDKCLAATTCSGGECVGTPKSCSTSAPCRVAACNPATGACEEHLAPAGQVCGGVSACMIDGRCDAAGACVGTPSPDNSPCENPACPSSGSCMSGRCTCPEQPDLAAPADLAASPAPSPPSAKSGGCDLAGGSPLPSGILMLLGLGLAFRPRKLQ